MAVKSMRSVFAEYTDEFMLDIDVKGSNVGNGNNGIGRYEI